MLELAGSAHQEKKTIYRVKPLEVLEKRSRLEMDFVILVLEERQKQATAVRLRTQATQLDFGMDCWKTG
jgi:hypothetical protein